MRKIKFILVAASMFFVGCTKEYVINVHIPDNADSTNTTTYNNYHVSYFLVNLSGNCNTYAIFLDRDSSGYYTDKKDSVVSYVTKCDGDSSKPPIITVEKSTTAEGCKVSTLLADGDIISSDTVCPDIVYVPTPPDTVVISKTDTLEIIKLVQDTMEIERMSETEYFDNPGNTNFYEKVKLYNLEPGYSANDLGSNHQNGSLVQWNETISDTAWSPELLEGYNLDYFSFRVGSSIAKHFFVLGKNSSGEIFVIDEVFLEPVINFNWINLKNYSKFEYDLDISKGINKIGWVVDTSSPQISNRNQKWNMDEFKYSGRKNIN